MTNIEKWENENWHKFKNTCEQMNDSLWYVNPEDVKTLLQTELTRIAEEVEKMKKDTRISNGRGSTGGVACAGCSTCGGQEDCCCEMYNQALTDILSLITLTKQEITLST